MRRHNNYRRAFYVVQFIELPFEGIDDYVCVPSTWLIVKSAHSHQTTDRKAVVAYPKDEDPFNTRDRAKRKERCNDEWRFYMAIVKYESDSYEDAEYWIATRNDYGPFIEEELKTTDTEPKFPLNKKLRFANRNHSSKLNDNPRKLLPRTSIKRLALPEPNKQLNGKRMKLNDAAQSSNAVTDANAGPESSRQEQSLITQDNQTMESAQTETTASNSNGTSSSSQRKDANLQESLPIQEQQELSMPSIDVDILTFFKDDDEEVQPTSIKEQQVTSNQAISQFTEQPEPIREPQIPVAPSIETASNNQRPRMDDVLNNGPSSCHLLNSRKISAQLYSQMNKARRLIPTQKPVEREIRPMNIARNLAIAEQNPPNLMDQTGSLSMGLLPTQQQQSYQNQYIPTNQNNFKQDLLMKSAKSNNYEQRPNSGTISMSTPSFGENSIIPSSPLYQTSELPQQRHSQPSQQDSQRQSQKPKIRIRISTKPKNNRQTPTFQVTKETLSPILTKVLNSLRRALSPSQNEQQLQGNHRERAPVNENHLNKIDNTLQTDEWMEEETPSAHHAANSDSDTVTDREEISDHEMSADEAHIERTSTFSRPNRTEEVSQFPEERHIKISARANSSNTNRYSKKVANNPLKKKHNNLWRFVLPPEYDPHDTKWTLKYRTYLLGLVELMPQSGVYVSYGDLKYCEQVSKDCKSLARRLLPEVFNRNALSVCLSMSERAQASNNVGSNIRPELDDSACSVLLNFVLEHGLQRGWNTDLQPILSILHSKIQEIRFKYGVMAQC